MLEGCRSIGEAKGHHCRFIETLRRAECGFPLISLPQADIVVSPAEVKGGEHLGLLQMVYQLRCQRKGVAVLNRKCIELPIVDNQAQSAVLLFYEEDRTCCRGLGRADVALPQVLLQVFRQRFLLRRRHRIHTSEGGCCTLSQVNRVIIRLPLRQPFRCLLAEHASELAEWWGHHLLKGLGALRSSRFFRNCLRPGVRCCDLVSSSHIRCNIELLAVLVDVLIPLRVSEPCWHLALQVLLRHLLQFRHRQPQGFGLHLPHSP